jgi:hypothetical protein
MIEEHRRHRRHLENGGSRLWEQRERVWAKESLEAGVVSGPRRHGEQQEVVLWR